MALSSKIHIAAGIAASFLGLSNARGAGTQPYAREHAPSLDLRPFTLATDCSPLLGAQSCVERVQCISVQLPRASAADGKHYSAAQRKHARELET